jgi:hypothetical protein
LPDELQVSLNIGATTVAANASTIAALIRTPFWRALTKICIEKLSQRHDAIIADFA